MIGSVQFISKIWVKAKTLFIFYIVFVLVAAPASGVVTATETGPEVRPQTDSSVDDTQLLNQVGDSSETNPPDPQITDVEIPDTVTAGEPFTIEIEATNQGGTSGKFSTITASFPQLDESTDDSQIEVVDSEFSRETTATAGTKIFTKSGDQVSARYALAEGSVGQGTWEPGETKSLTVEVIPEETGTFEIRYRTTLTRNGDTNSKYTAPDRSGTPDQQGYNVNTKEVTVESQSGDQIGDTTSEDEQSLRSKAERHSLAVSSQYRLFRTELFNAKYFSDRSEENAQEVVKKVQLDEELRDAAAEQALRALGKDVAAKGLSYAGTVKNLYTLGEQLYLLYKSIAANKIATNMRAADGYNELREDIRLLQENSENIRNAESESEKREYFETRKELLEEAYETSIRYERSLFRISVSERPEFGIGFNSFVSDMSYVSVRGSTATLRETLRADYVSTTAYIDNRPSNQQLARESNQNVNPRSIDWFSSRRTWYGELETVGDVDWYRVEVSDASAGSTLAIVSANNVDVPTETALYDRKSSNSDPIATAGNDGQLSVSDIAPGTYYVKVTADDNRGQYALTGFLKNPNKWLIFDGEKIMESFEPTSRESFQSYPDPQISKSSDIRVETAGTPTVGEPIDVRVTATNNGGPAEWQSIAIGLPNITDTDAVTVNSQGLSYTETIAPGTEVGAAYGQNNAELEYVLVEGAQTEWGSSTRTLDITVTPQSPGSFNVYVKSVAYGLGRWDGEPGRESGDTTDGQGEDVYVKTVDIQPDRITLDPNTARRNGRDTVVLRANASAADRDSLSYTWKQTEGPEVALSDAGSEQASFARPDLDRERRLTFAVTASDDDGTSATETVSVTVAPTNEPPSVAATTSGSGADVTLVAEGSDPDNDTLSYSWQQTEGPDASLSDRDNRTTSLSAPNADKSQTLTFEVTVDDGNGETASDTVSVAVSDLNEPPTASDVRVSGTEDSAVDGNFDASDPNGDLLTYSVTSDPDNGSVEIDNDSFTYTPDSGYSGSDSFTYEVSDGNGGTATATVSVTVNDIQEPSTSESTPESTETPTPTPTPESTETPTPTPTPESTETPTPTPTPTLTPESTETPTPTPTPELTETPTPTPTPESTETPTPSETPEPTETPTPESSPEPAETPAQLETPESVQTPSTGVQDSDETEQLLEIVATEQGEISYEVVVRGSAEKATLSEKIKAQGNDEIRERDDGTVVIDGYTGNTGYGDAYRISGEIVDYRRVDGDVDVDIRLDGNSVTPAALSSGGSQPGDDTGATADSGREQGASVLEIISTEKGEISYEVVIDGSAEKVRVSDKVAGTNNDDIRQRNGNTVIQGYTGDIGYGDAYRITGEIVEFRRLDGDVDINIQLDGEPVSKAELSTGMASSSSDDIPASDGDSQEQPSLLEIVANEQGEISYEVVVEGSVEKTTVSEKIKSQPGGNDQIRRRDGNTVVIEGYTGNTGYGDAYLIDGEVVEFRRVDGDVGVTIRRDGDRVSPDQL